MAFTALSVIQPWPWLILRPDLVDGSARQAAAAGGRIKDCENRDWETPVRGWVLLHASSTRLARWTYQEAALFAVKLGVDIPLRDNLPYGAVVGAIRVDGCRRSHASPWFTGPFAFFIGASVPFAAPVSCPGSLKFFHIPLPGFGIGGQELVNNLAVAVRAAGLETEFRIGGAL